MSLPLRSEYQYRLIGIGLINGTVSADLFDEFLGKKSSICYDILLFISQWCSAQFRNTNITAGVIAKVPHLHPDLFTRNLTLINITNFQFIINNDICNTTSITLVVIVHSALQNSLARDIIRFVSTRVKVNCKALFRSRYISNP